MVLWVPLISVVPWVALGPTSSSGFLRFPMFPQVPSGSSGALGNPGHACTVKVTVVGVYVCVSVCLLPSLHTTSKYASKSDF